MVWKTGTQNLCMWMWRQRTSDRSDMWIKRSEIFLPTHIIIYSWHLTHFLLFFIFCFIFAIACLGSSLQSLLPFPLSSSPQKWQSNSVRGKTVIVASIPNHKIMLPFVMNRMWKENTNSNMHAFVLVPYCMLYYPLWNVWPTIFIYKIIVSPLRDCLRGQLACHWLLLLCNFMSISNQSINPNVHVLRFCLGRNGP